MGVFVNLLLSSFLGAGAIALASSPKATKAPAAGLVTAGATSPYATTRGAHALQTPPFPQLIDCSITYVTPTILAPYNPFGPGCAFYSLAQGVDSGNTANAGVAAANIITSLADFLNITNAEIANLNATLQELTSYYENRAEAIVPYFLNATSWNQTIQDQVLIDSGLIPSIEGLELAFGQQQYQDWNATVQSWNLAFGSAGQWHASTADMSFGGSLNMAVNNGQSVNISLPYEFISNPCTAHSCYFNMMPGGTIFERSGGPSYDVFDVTTGGVWALPVISDANWFNQTNIPQFAHLHPISQFDLLKLVCISGCTGPEPIETSGAFFFENATSLGFAGHPSIPAFDFYGVTLINHANPGGASVTVVPGYNAVTCIVVGSTSGPCTTYSTQSSGISAPANTGPNSVVGGNSVPYGYAFTANRLVNNTELMAYDYWLTLRAITANGKYSIPSICVIPTPSQAFPDATDFANYKLNAPDIEGVYLSYLNAVGRAFNQGFTNVQTFCGNPNLSLTFNWSASWKLNLNVTASIYYSNSTKAIFPNGTADPTSVYAMPATWPVRNVDPTLLYPFEYQLNVPTNTVFPVPGNNPIATVLVNYSLNPLYLQPSPKPEWGIPTYTELYGNGNFVFANGNTSTFGSGRTNATGDAIDITSCTLNGTPQNPCKISVVYFSNFTTGIVHGVAAPFKITPVPIPGLGGLGSIGSDCGFGNLNQWYDGWAGWVGSAVSQVLSSIGSAGAGIPIIGGGWQFFWSGLGCILSWIVVIIAFFLLVYVVIKVARWAYDAWRD